MSSSGTVKLTKDVEITIEGKSVILVEDIVDTGSTLLNIIDHLAVKAPESIRICTLIDKLERRNLKVPVDYFGFKIERGFIVGYGLDYNEEYRCSRDIYVLNQ